MVPFTPASMTKALITTQIYVDVGGNLEACRPGKLNINTSRAASTETVKLGQNLFIQEPMERGERL